MFDGCADVFHAGFVAAFAFALAVFAAFGHFRFHVAEQFFSFFVFALFAQFIDFAFGLFEELVNFVVIFPLGLFAFAAFALAAEFGNGVLHALEYVGGFFFFTGFA